MGGRELWLESRKGEPTHLGSWRGSTPWTHWEKRLRMAEPQFMTISLTIAVAFPSLGRELPGYISSSIRFSASIFAIPSNL